MIHLAALHIFLAIDRHTGDNIAEWMVQQLRENDISASFYQAIFLDKLGEMKVVFKPQSCHQREKILNALSFLLYGKIIKFDCLPEL